MSRPDDIPEDIWDAATESLRQLEEDHRYGFPEAYEPIARAVLAERERCAKTAEARSNLYGVEGNLACREVAGSIRAGETA